MTRHLAVFNKEDSQKIFSGKRKIEARFSHIKIPPFGKVSAGDSVLIKIGGEKITGQFLVDRVIYFDHPTKDEVESIKNKYGPKMALAKTFWLEREKVSYVTLMFIKSVTKFIIPPNIKKKDLRPWVVLE